MIGMFYNNLKMNITNSNGQLLAARFMLFNQFLFIFLLHHSTNLEGEAKEVDETIGILVTV